MAIKSPAPHPFTLRQLQYAVAVADTSSFRRAAERCRVSQPSLSAQIAAMEGAIGVRLFERTARRVLLTQAGRELIERARRVLADADDLAAVAAGARDPLASVMRIGVIPTIAPYLLPEVTPAVRQAFPKLVPVWVEEKTGTLVRRLGEGSLDAAILAMEADLGPVESAVLAVDEFVLAAAVDHPVGRTDAPALPDELREVSVLLLEDGHCLRDQTLSFCARADARELEFRATSLTTLVQMVTGGVGVTLLPRLAVPAETRRAQLRIRPFVDPAPHRTVALVWRPRSPAAQALRRLAVVLHDAWPSGRESA